jgi:SAM-dependent methyltransferase
MTSPLSKLGALVSEKGLGGAIRYIPERALEIVRERYDHRFDEAFGTSTSGISALKDLEIDSPHRALGLRYEGVSAKQFRRMMKRIQMAHEEYTFIDYGSGKGRVLFLAAEYPFKQILGVEFAPALHDIAVRNIASYRNPEQRCRNIQAICADAVEYQPPDGPLMCFFYNPFKPPVFDLFLTNLKRSLDARPRPFILVFYGRNEETIRFFQDRWPSTSELFLPRDWTRRERYRAFVTRVG